MKRFFTILIFAILFGGGAMAYDFSAVCESGQTLYYKITSNTEPYTVEIVSIWEVGFSDYCGNMDIPAHVNHNGVVYSVVRIGEEAFNSCNGLTSVSIPSTVTSIGGEAFAGCYGLTSVTIPNSVTSIGGGAFSGSGLTSLTIPSSVISIGNGAFSGCTELRELTIPNSVNSIGPWAFSSCCSLTSLTIPNSVTSIGSGAFENCSGLSSIAIPNSVTYIGPNAFIETNWYDNYSDGILYLDGWCLGYKGEKPTGSLTIADGTKEIANHAFYDCYELASVTIPSSVTNIDAESFFYNTRITLSPDNTNFRIVDDVLFNWDMTKLISFYGSQESYEIPNSVTDIGRSAFRNCYGLTSITIPSSVTNIGLSAFVCELTSVYYTGTIDQWCRITFVTHEDYTYSIWSQPLLSAHNLYVDNNLITDLIIPETVTEIKECAFYGATCLTSLTISNSVTSIGADAFGGCSGVASLTIPNSVTSIGESAFSGCSGLTSVTIPNSVTSIGREAFVGCSGLTSVTIPNSVTSIGNYTFYNCSGLTSVTIPNNVVSIGACAFEGCRNLVSIAIPSSVTNIGTYTFSGTGWKNNQPDGILYLDGWCLGYKGESPVGSLTIANGTKGIANYAFYGCNGLTSVTIPSSVRSIGEDAFADCRGLTSLIIPNSVTEIGRGAFGYNENLDSVSIGSSLEKIGPGILCGSTNLKSVSILVPDPLAACNMFILSGDGEIDVAAGENMRLYVPCGAREAYAASSWADWFSEIREMPDCAGVEENSIENEMELYPNPVGNTLNITSSETISEIEIVNVMGQVVKHMEVNSDNVVCNVEDLKAGVYMVRIYSRPFGSAQGAVLRKFVKE